MGARTNAFIRGLGGMFSWVDVLNRRLLAETPAEANAEAIHSYWQAVGGYMYDAMDSYSADHNIYPATGEEEICQKTGDSEKPSLE